VTGVQTCALPIFTALYFVPLTVGQVSQLSRSIPTFVANLPQWLADTDAWLRAHNLNLSISTLYNTATLQTRVEAAAGQVLQYAITAATAVASAVATALLVLAVSFYMMMDGRRFVKEIATLVPGRFQDEFRYSSKTFDEIFGGFARVQALMALLYAAGAGIVVTVAAIPYAFAVTWICGLAMLVPLVGAPVAMVLPALIALLTVPQSALWVLIVLTAYQNVLLHLVVPKIQSQSMRMPTIMVMAAALVGGVLLGVWGVIFGVPIGAVFYSLAFYFVRQRRRRQEKDEAVSWPLGGGGTVPSDAPPTAPKPLCSTPKPK
jgi:predicted PurR-regulated permease PerM